VVGAEMCSGQWAAKKVASKRWSVLVIIGSMSIYPERFWREFCGGKNLDQVIYIGKKARSTNQEKTPKLNLP